MRPLQRVDYIIIHCSATDDGPDCDYEAIRRYHIENNGWQDIGYHFLIEREHGQILTHVGRPTFVEGAHCKAAGRNHDSLGVCIVGDFDNHPPNFDIWVHAVVLVAKLCQQYEVPSYNVNGHSEYEEGKTCPGLEFNMSAFRTSVRDKLATWAMLKEELEQDVIYHPEYDIPVEKQKLWYRIATTAAKLIPCLRRKP